jgi:ribosomal protein L21E
MSRFTTGDRVRVDIPDMTDPDHDRYHGVHGTVVDVLDDRASEVTGDDRDESIFRVELENGETADFRWRDLRPSIE